MAAGETVLVYGALRSGTTVFRLMLNAHPGLHNPGEADYLFDHLRGTGGGWRYDLEALGLDRVFESAGLALPDGPGADGPALLEDLLGQLAARDPGRLVLAIHRHVDRAAALLPGARIIHLLRDPRDVARSCIGMGWAGTPYHGVRLWLDTERAWERTAPRLPPERVLTLKYEDLIAAPEAELGRVCAFLGVDFAPEMLRYHETTTYGPPDPALIAQWRRKLGPDDLALLEGRIGALLTARGYAPSGAAPRSPGALERAALGARDRIAVWRHAAAHHGAGLVLAEKLSRRLGLRGVHRHVRRRINARRRALLK